MAGKVTRLISGAGILNSIYALYPAKISCRCKQLLKKGAARTADRHPIPTKLRLTYLAAGVAVLALFFAACFLCFFTLLVVEGVVVLLEGAGV